MKKLVYFLMVGLAFTAPQVAHGDPIYQYTHGGPIGNEIRECLRTPSTARCQGVLNNPALPKDIAECLRTPSTARCQGVLNPMEIGGDESDDDAIAAQIPQTNPIYQYTHGGPIGNEIRECLRTPSTARCQGVLNPMEIGGDESDDDAIAAQIPQTNPIYQYTHGGPIGNEIRECLRTPSTARCQGVLNNPALPKDIAECLRTPSTARCQGVLNPMEIGGDESDDDAIAAQIPQTNPIYQYTHGGPIGNEIRECLAHAVDRAMPRCAE